MCEKSSLLLKDVRENLFHCGLLEIIVIDWLIGVSPKLCNCLLVVFFLDVCIQVSLFHKDSCPIYWIKTHSVKLTLTWLPL